LLHIQRPDSRHHESEDAMLSFALLAAAVLIGGLVLLRLRDAQRSFATPGRSSSASLDGAMQQTAAVPPPRQSQAVAMVLRVQNPACACENARKFADKTFLISDAPNLPFKDCTRADCRCRYERVAERRTPRGERRVSASRREEIRFEMKDDRRSGKDRRQKNNVWKQPV
jgi:hypothetical protein